MKIQLFDHDYRFAVEQTIMALLPDQSIETIENMIETPQNYPYIKTYLEKNEVSGKGTARCVLRIPPHTYEAVHEYHLEIEELEVKRADQFALKESIYQATIQHLPSPPPWGNLTGVRPAKLASKLILKENNTKSIRGENTKHQLESIYHVDKIRSEIAVDCAKISLNYQNKLRNTISIYGGIPFCPSRCGYCSFFASDIRKYQDKLPDYIKGIIAEFHALAPYLPREKVSTMYLGGGTPTVLDVHQLNQVVSTMNDLFRSENLLEFTVEAGRPDTLNSDKFATLEQAKVHRISINPQTMNNDLLKKLGRNHSVEEIYSAVEQAKGKFILNMDLIAGLHGDTEENFNSSLSQVLSLNPEQITIHSLTLKKNTPYSEKKLENISILENDVSDTKEVVNQGKILENMLNQGNTALKKQDYAPYYLYRQKKIAGGLENVGWARKNFQGSHEICVYNVAMMEEFQSIIGFGASAMTKLMDHKGNLKRHQNPKYFWEYLDKLPEIIEIKQALLRNYWETQEKNNSLHKEL